MTKESRAGKSAEKRLYATPALEKGLDVIELLAHQPQGLTKSEVARELNRTVSEIFRMLLCLERRGYISQIENERYSLTLKLFKLVQEHPPTERLIAEALPVMHRLAHQTQQSCHLAIVQGGEVVIIAQVNSMASTNFSIKLGATVPLMDAASGYVILAHQDDAHRERTLAGWRAAKDHAAAPADLDVHLARIQRAGFERRESYQVRGVVNISFPVFDDRGSAMGALTVPFIQRNDGSASLAEVITSLRSAASEITTAIGGRLPEKVSSPHLQRSNAKSRARLDE